MPQRRPSVGESAAEVAALMDTGAVNFLCLWGFGIPVTYYFALSQGGGLESAWNWINAPYTCMNIAMCHLCHN